VKKYFDNLAELINTMKTIFPEEGLGAYTTLLEGRRAKPGWEAETIVKVGKRCEEFRKHIREKDEEFFRGVLRNAQTDSSLEKEEKEVMEHISKIWTTKRKRINREKEEQIWKRLQTMCGVALRYNGMV
jgi:phage-related tail protein